MFDFVAATPPPPSAGGNYAKLNQFLGKLVCVIPYEDNILSKFKSQEGKDQYQTRATVVPVQSGSWTSPKDGEETSWEAGEVFDVFISNARVRRQIKELHTPVLGRLLMDGKAMVLETPTEAQIELAKKVLADVDIPDKRGHTTKVEDDGKPPWE